MKKTISYKVAQPPFGIKGGFALRNQITEGVVNNRVYIPYGNPFMEATCVYLGREGTVIALASPKEDGSGIEYRSCIASALISQSFQLRGEFSKVIGNFDPALAKYVDQLVEPYDVTQNVIAHSIYTKTAATITESLSKAIASDESEIIDFSYKIDYYPTVLDKYANLAGSWFKTTNGEFYNPFANNETGAMQNLYQAEGLGAISRSGNNGANQFQAPDGSFISFWPIDISDLAGGYSYDAQGLADLIADGVTTLGSARQQQEEAWTEEYTPA
jgi:hypothetical protein